VKKEAVRMDRWWSDGSETGSRLWQGVFAIAALGCALGIAQNALVARGAPKDALAWRYTPPVVPTIEGVQQTNGGAAAAPAAAPAGTTAYTDSPLNIGEASAGAEIPDVNFPMQIQITRVKQMYEAKEATIIDARDPQEYADGHIPGAVNLPHETTVTDLDKLEKFDPKGKPIIVYCGGGTCEASLQLGYALIGAGKHKVLVFMGGWPEWQTSGFPIAKGPTPEGA